MSKPIILPANAILALLERGEVQHRVPLSKERVLNGRGWKGADSSYCLEEVDEFSIAPYQKCLFPIGSEWIVEGDHIGLFRCPITLVVVSNRVEQLQKIDRYTSSNWSDYKAELGGSCIALRSPTFRDAFIYYWDFRYDKTEFAWDKNPWIEVPMLNAREKRDGRTIL